MVEYVSDQILHSPLGMVQPSSGITVTYTVKRGYPSPGIGFATGRPDHRHDAGLHRVGQVRPAFDDGLQIRVR
jgi:hypothetical protein